jgi:hypothetical protein
VTVLDKVKDNMPAGCNMRKEPLRLIYDPERENFDQTSDGPSVDRRARPSAPASTVDDSADVEIEAVFTAACRLLRSGATVTLKGTRELHAQREMAGLPSGITREACRAAVDLLLREGRLAVRGKHLALPEAKPPAGKHTNDREAANV